MSVRITVAGPVTPQMLAKLPNDTLYPDILATIIVTFVLVTIFTALRLVTKWLTKSWNLQDLLLVVVWALSLAYNFTFLKWGKVGVGQHVWMITPPQGIEILKVGWVVSIVYGPMIWLAKAVLLLQIINIFAPNKSQSKAVFWTAQVLIWGNFMLYTATFFVAIFQCTPVRKAWHSELSGHCINVNATYTFTGAANVVSDVLILLLPLWAIWHLRMAPKHKLGISAVFATATFCIISSICRLVYTIRLFNNKDRIYIFGEFALWTMAEAASIIICSCLPLMPRLWQVLRKKANGSNPHKAEPYKPERRVINRPMGQSDSGLAPLKQSDAPSEMEKGRGFSDGGFGASQSIESTRSTEGTPNGIQRTVSIELVREK